MDDNKMYQIVISKMNIENDVVYILHFNAEVGFNAFVNNLDHLAKTLDLVDGCNGDAVRDWIELFLKRAGRTKKDNDIVTYLTSDEFPVFAITIMSQAIDLDCDYIKLLGENKGHDMIVQAQHKIIEDLHDKVLHYKEILGEDADEMDDMFSVNKGPKYYS